MHITKDQPSGAYTSVAASRQRHARAADERRGNMHAPLVDALQLLFCIAERFAKCFHPFIVT